MRVHANITLRFKRRCATEARLECRGSGVGWLQWEGLRAPFSADFDGENRGLERDC